MELKPREQAPQAPEQAKAQTVAMQVTMEFDTEYLILIEGHLECMQQLCKSLHVRSK